MKYALPLLAVLAFSVPSYASDVILNEYNAVAGTKLLSNSGSDSSFGQVAGNGGDWFELVVIKDHLDMRNWSFDIYEDSVFAKTLTLTSELVFSNLRSGTIITVAEDVADDISYNPAAGDWWINLQANNNGTGRYISKDNFSVSEKSWQLLIKDASGNSIFGSAGEGVSPASGVNDQEVCKLQENPSAAITPLSAYSDGTTSTFGAPNIWSQGASSQDFSSLRSVVPEPATLAILTLGGICFITRKSS